MKENMTDKEQVTWIFKETGRMIYKLIVGSFTNLKRAHEYDNHMRAKLEGLTNYEFINRIK